MRMRVGWANPPFPGVCVCVCVCALRLRVYARVHAPSPPGCARGVCMPTCVCPGGRAPPSSSFLCKQGVADLRREFDTALGRLQREAQDRASTATRAEAARVVNEMALHGEVERLQVVWVCRACFVCARVRTDACAAAWVVGL